MEKMNGSIDKVREDIEGISCSEYYGKFIGGEEEVLHQKAVLLSL